MNKGLTDAELLRGIRTAMESGYRKIKLYFMIGLPGKPMPMCSASPRPAASCSVSAPIWAGWS